MFVFPTRSDSSPSNGPAETRGTQSVRKRAAGPTPFAYASRELSSECETISCGAINTPEHLCPSSMKFHWPAWSTPFGSSNGEFRHP
jgi:hypothetical protein